MERYFLLNYYGYYIPYWLLILSILILQLNKNSNLSKNINKIVFSICIFFIIFRFDIEFDYVWYWIVGDTRFEGYWFYEFGYKRVEPFYKLVYQITRNLKNPKIFFIITGLFFSYFFFKSLKKYSKNQLFTLSIYYYIPGLYFSFLVGFIRQGLACVIYLFFIEKLKKKKYLSYSIVIFLTGALVHKSVLVVLLLIPVHYFYMKSKSKLFVIEISSIILFIYIDKVLKYVPFLNKYAFYLTNRIYNFLGYKSVLLVFILYLIMIVIIKISKVKLSKEEKFQIHIVELGFLIFLLLGIKIGGHVPMRVSIYFLIFFPIIFSNIIDKLKKKKVIVILISGCLFIIASLNLLKIVNNEYKNLGGRASYNYKLLFFYDYNDLNGKYTPHGKIEFNN